MASIWKIGAVDIYTLNHSPKGDVKLAKLTPLDSEEVSVVHFFGAGAEEVEIKGWVFSEANITAIKNYRKAGTTVVLTSDQGNEGNFVIANFDFDKFGPYVSLSLPGYATNATIYKFSAKLIKV